jgi:hypothetical protein
MKNPMTESAIQPALTPFDLMVLKALQPADSMSTGDPWRDEYDVARYLRVDDVLQVRATLRGLEWFAYAHVDGAWPNERWTLAPRGVHAVSKDAG